MAAEDATGLLDCDLDAEGSVADSLIAVCTDEGLVQALRKGAGMRRFSIAVVLAGLLGAAGVGVAAVSGWSIQRTPNGAGFSQGGGKVSCASKSFCIAVGDDFSNGGLVIERWNGSSWSPQHSSDLHGVIGGGISCASKTACTAVGATASHSATLAERWNGSRWFIEETPYPGRAIFSDLYSVSCTSVSSCTAVGSYQIGNGNGNGQILSLAERWNGKRWSIQKTPKLPDANFSELTSVSCTAVSSCTAVGSYAAQASDAAKFHTLVERWNGTKWLVQHTPRIRESSGLRGVSCTSASSCTAVGSYGDFDKRTLVTLAERWNGKKWSIQHTPNPHNDSRLWDVSCTSGNAPSSPFAIQGGREKTTRPTTSCTAVGSYQIGQQYGQDATVAERWNGKKWSIQHTPTVSGSSQLSGVSCTSVNSCTAVGNYGERMLAERWTGG
jgi:hypothetical protein